MSTQRRKPVIRAHRTYERAGVSGSLRRKEGKGERASASRAPRGGGDPRSQGGRQARFTGYGSEGGRVKRRRNGGIDYGAGRHLSSAFYASDPSSRGLET